MGANELHPRDTVFQNRIMRIMLPPIQKDGKTYYPGINESFDSPRGNKLHGAIDGNYHDEKGGKVGQHGVNLEGPTVHAPVSGTVTKAGNDQWNTVEITDKNGFKHQILHMNLDKKEVHRGQQVTQGDQIGRMGNQGSKDYHVHYQITGPVDPTKPLGDPQRKSKLIDPNTFPYDGPKLAGQNQAPGKKEAAPADPGAGTSKAAPVAPPASAPEKPAAKPPAAASKEPQGAQKPAAPTLRPPAQISGASAAQSSAGRSVNALASQTTAPQSRNVLASQAPPERLNALASPPQNVNALSYRRSPSISVNALAARLAGAPMSPWAGGPDSRPANAGSPPGAYSISRNGEIRTGDTIDIRSRRDKLDVLLPLAREAIKTGNNQVLQRLLAGAKADPHVSSLIPPDFAITTQGPGETKASGTLKIDQLLPLYRAPADPTLRRQIGKAKPGRYEYTIKDGRVTGFRPVAKPAPANPTPGDSPDNLDGSLVNWIERNPGRKPPRVQPLPYPIGPQSPSYGETPLIRYYPAFKRTDPGIDYIDSLSLGGSGNRRQANLNALADRSEGAKILPVPPQVPRDKAILPVPGVLAAAAIAGSTRALYDLGRAVYRNGSQLRNVPAYGTPFPVVPDAPGFIHSLDEFGKMPIY